MWRPGRMRGGECRVRPRMAWMCNGSALFVAFLHTVSPARSGSAPAGAALLSALYVLPPARLETATPARRARGAAFEPWLVAWRLLATGWRPLATAGD
eukprot:7009173-Prymnesium_polylepis.2